MTDRPNSPDRPGSPGSRRGYGGRTLVALVAGVAALAALVALAVVVLRTGEDEPAGAGQDGNPFAERQPYTWPGTEAAKAVDQLSGEDAELVRRIAETPTAVWLTPERYPIGKVGDVVSGIVADAREADRVPLFVVYGIPHRDCSGGYSAGGLDAGEYHDWVAEIARAAGTRAAVILEPDALASAPDCGLTDEREELLSSAVDVLADGPTTYLDAGHSGWIDADTMAQLLEKAGVSRVRGFAVNVSGFGTDEDEQNYAEQIIDALGGGHYVIDTSRNGNGPGDTWCNPPGRALGRTPAAGPEGSSLDAYLWVKPPGDSDGTCNGGPPAGQFWPEQAVEMARAAGW